MNHQSNVSGGEDIVSQQQIQMLKKKVAEYEARIYHNLDSLSTGYKSRDYDSIHVFEERVIYDLKAEN